MNYITLHILEHRTKTLMISHFQLETVLKCCYSDKQQTSHKCYKLVNNSDHFIDTTQIFHNIKILTVFWQKKLISDIPVQACNGV